MPMTLSSAELQSSKPPEDSSQKSPETHPQHVPPVAFQQAMTDLAVGARHQQREASRANPGSAEKPGSKPSARAEKKPHVPHSDVQNPAVEAATATPVQEPPTGAITPIASVIGVPPNVPGIVTGSQTIAVEAAGAPVNSAAGKSQVAIGKADQPLIRSVDAEPVESGESMTQAQPAHSEHPLATSDAEPQPRLTEAITSAVHTLSVSVPAAADVPHAGSLTIHQTSLRQPLSTEQSAAQTPEQLLTQQPEQHAVVSAAGALEVGMGIGTHGWLRVRASLESDGSVATQLVTSTAATADKLQKDLSALTAYLAEQQIAVSSTVVHAIEHTAAAQNVLAGDTSSTFSDAAGGQQGQQENQSGRQPASLRNLGYTSATDLGMQPTHGLLPLGQSIAGGWLSVRV